MIRSIARLILPRFVKDYIRKEAAAGFYSCEFPTAERDVPSPYPSIIDLNNGLERLGQTYNPTKRGHNYLPYYWLHFRDIREEVRKVLEIGVESDRSIGMWEEFFPNAQIYGLDVDPSCKQFESARRKIFIGDQNDPATLRNIIEQTGRALDVVIDDGSHLPEHQMRTFDYLFPALTSHGIYVMEDIDIGNPEHPVLHSLKKLIDNVNFWPVEFSAGDWPQLSTFPETATWIDKHVAGIAFYRYIAFIFKGRNPEDNPYLHKR